ncbi:MAG: hypothetical protein Kow002_11830 [Anaerolineales bacterium]
MTDAHDHRQLAADLFNRTWELLDKNDRTRVETDEMVHAAHASRYHWGLVGTALHLARGEWQISRVYAMLRQGESAQYHAQRSLGICQENDLGDFDLAFAYEALARAASVLGDNKALAEYLALARQAAENITEQDDKDYFVSELESIKI